MIVEDAAAPARSEARQPRLGFLGVGWIGADRLRAVAHDGVATVTAVADSSSAAVEAIVAEHPSARAVTTLDELLALDLDGIVIATPSALHAEQSIAALERGLAVFCQKPLGRTRAETQAVVDAARHADRLLGVDVSYRHMAATTAVAARLRDIGRVYAIELTFHNAYGPDKGWFYDVSLSGGGCVIDLGTHLVDLALWSLGFPAVLGVTSRLYSEGRVLARPPDAVEDHAVALLELEGDVAVQVACSWNLHAGTDAVIAGDWHGTSGGLSIRNVGGSFYDFQAFHHVGTTTTTLAEPPDAWGGRAITAWATRLAHDPSFDPEADHLVAVAAAVDAIYGRA